LGNRTETIRPDGQRIGYLHYGSGHLHGITLNRNEIAAFERDKLHRETERTFGKHIRQETQYDPMGRILQQIHNRSRREYGYDAAGQLTHIQNRGDQTQYRYDPIGRLIAAVTPDFSETFAFDPANNRLDLSGNKQDHTDQANSQEKSSLNKVWGNLLKEYAGVHYDYDQRGNLIRKTRNGETTDYHWNGYNQLIKIENRNGSTEYRYDPLGRRTAKIRNGETTVYHWQEDTLAIESTNGQNTHYLFEPDTFEPLAQFQTTSPIGIEREDKPAEPYGYDPETDPLLKIPPEPQGQSEAQPELVYYQLDHLGTPIAAHNAKGEAVWTAEYEAWGRIRNETVSDGLKANIPFRFQGQYYDEESGLHYNRFRYYDPEIGRFVSQDPIGLQGGMNLFEYAPNPIVWIDFLGLTPSKKSSRSDDPARQKCGTGKWIRHPEKIEHATSYNEARRRAIKESRLEGVPTKPFISYMGPDKGKVLGSQSLDGYNHWRIDYDPKSSKQFHVNWRRIYRDKKGNCVQETGAYLLPGGQDSYWYQRERMPKL